MQKLVANNTETETLRQTRGKKKKKKVEGMKTNCESIRADKAVFKMMVKEPRFELVTSHTNF